MSNIFGIKDVISKRTYQKKIDPKCDYANCFAGHSLAGRGVCFLNGDPTRCDCSEFEFESVAIVRLTGEMPEKRKR